MPETTIILHGTPLSGHCHRVELLLRMLGLPYRYREAGAEVRRSPDFLTLNPLGQIPVLEDGDLVLSDSNAILVYLARRYGADTVWMPRDPVGEARVQRWLSIAAGEVMYGPATARMVSLWGMPGDLERSRAIGGRVLAFMEGHLASGPGFLVGEQATLADLACYSYVAHAPEGGIDLAPFSAIRPWLARVEALPGFFSMPCTEARAA